MAQNDEQVRAAWSEARTALGFLDSDVLAGIFADLMGKDVIALPAGRASKGDKVRALLDHVLGTQETLEAAVRVVARRLHAVPGLALAHEILAFVSADGPVKRGGRRARAASARSSGVAALDATLVAMNLDRKDQRAHFSRACDEGADTIALVHGDAKQQVGLFLQWAQWRAGERSGFRSVILPWKRGVSRPAGPDGWRARLGWALKGQADQALAAALEQGPVLLHVHGRALQDRHFEEADREALGGFLASLPALCPPSRGRHPLVVLVGVQAPGAGSALLDALHAKLSKAPLGAFEYLALPRLEMPTEQHVREFLRKHYAHLPDEARAAALDRACELLDEDADFERLVRAIREELEIYDEEPA